MRAVYFCKCLLATQFPHQSFLPLSFIYLTEVLSAFRSDVPDSTLQPTPVKEFVDSLDLGYVSISVDSDYDIGIGVPVEFLI